MNEISNIVNGVEKLKKAGVGNYTSRALLNKLYRAENVYDCLHVRLTQYFGDDLSEIKIVVDKKGHDA